MKRLTLSKCVPVLLAGVFLPPNPKYVQFDFGFTISGVRRYVSSATAVINFQNSGAPERIRTFMRRLVDCFENSLVEGRIYRYTLSPKAAAVFPLRPARVGEGWHIPYQTPRPAHHAQRRRHSAQRRGYWVCSAIHQVCSDMHQKQAICRK